MGCDLAIAREDGHLANFNPRTPVGCDHHSGTPRRTTRGFQSTHPSGVRRDTGEFLGHLGEISIHAPQWGATVASAPPLLTTLFQSTHPSGVRPACAPRSRSASRISIHAPQWGATFLPSYINSFKQYFNPRTPVGCDFAVRSPSCRVLAFQSTHPSGVRPLTGLVRRGLRGISIHAPQWGATCPVPHVVPTTTFQSTHPSGVRRRPAMRRGCVPVYFNPRTPVGCDCYLLVERADLLHFNPRTPVGCDHVRARLAHGGHISIHAPQWGATFAFVVCQPMGLNFNPRTPVGCDTVSEVADRADAVFQSTHPSWVRQTS